MSACAILDDQITSRSDILNDATDNAKNNGILINIIRASHSQPLNFLAISKATGTQTTDFKIGLPNVTFGPSQTAAQKQYTFSGSTWDNLATTSFDSAPLATHDFYNDMLTPVPLQVMAAFIQQGFSRELVFNALIDSIRVDGLSPPLELRNDPLVESGSAACVPADQYYGDDGERSLYNPYNPGAKSYSSTRNCEYHRFQFFLQQGMKWGLNIETKEVDNPAYSDAAAKAAKDAGKTPPAKTIVQARFCFDPAFAQQNQVATVTAFPENAKCNPASKKPVDASAPLTIQFQSGSGLSLPLTFTIRPRTPMGAFRYFGHLARLGNDNAPKLYWRDSVSEAGGAQIFYVENSMANNCFARAVYFGQTYCVPANAPDGTKQVFEMLDSMVALSVATGSLPTTLDVRLQ